MLLLSHPSQTRQGFLLESKLQVLLTPLDRNEQSLMKLDSIFKVAAPSPYPIAL